MIEYFASLKPIATWRLAVFRFLRFLYWKLPSSVQSYIRSPANRLLHHLGIHGLKIRTYEFYTPHVE